jgi:hypothetical protein
MSRIDSCGVGERQDLFANARYEQVVIASRQIPTANAAPEKHIAAEE